MKREHLLLGALANREGLLFVGSQEAEDSMSLNLESSLKCISVRSVDFTKLRASIKKLAAGKIINSSEAKSYQRSLNYACQLMKHTKFNESESNVIPQSKTPKTTFLKSSLTKFLQSHQNPRTIYQFNIRSKNTLTMQKSIQNEAKPNTRQDANCIQFGSRIRADLFCT